MRLKIILSIFLIFLALELISFGVVNAEAIRPANQENLNKGYMPLQGSSYSSSGSQSHDKPSDIRPAPQTTDRGVGEQIRPANQIDLQKDFKPSEGSDYSSGIDGQQNAKISMYVVLNPQSKTEFVLNETTNETEEVIVTSDASGSGSFVLDELANSLSFNISYQGLSSNETSATINRIFNNTVETLYVLPLGQKKIGIWTYDQCLELDIKNGLTYIDIKSILFPAGELKGEILMI
ncbi:MAG: CHRD domain-containing protein [Candidatus Pacearchaeota archaeon]